MKPTTVVSHISVHRYGKFVSRYRHKRRQIRNRSMQISRNKNKHHHEEKQELEIPLLLDTGATCDHDCIHSEEEEEIVMELDDMYSCTLIRGGNTDADNERFGDDDSYLLQHVEESVEEISHSDVSLTSGIHRFKTIIW